MNLFEKMIVATLALILLSLTFGCGSSSSAPQQLVPGAPTGLTATYGNGQVSLVWNAVTGATVYNLYYATTSPVSISSATKVGSLAATSYIVTGLTNGTVYYFAVTAANAKGESSLSGEASATPTNGNIVNLNPGTAASSTLQYSSSTTLTFNFPANVVSQSATATISPVAQSGLPVPMGIHGTKKRRAKPQVQPNDTFLAAFQITVEPTSIIAFNVPVGVGGTQTLNSTLVAGTTLNLAMLQSNAWVDITTLIVDASGKLNQTLPSLTLPGLLAPGIYLFYMPANTVTVSNLGIALITDDGYGMGDGQTGLQVIHFYDTTGALLPTPTIAYLDYPNEYDLDGAALTPSGAQGVIIDGSNMIGFFSGVQTGVPVASTYTLDVSAYGSDGDSVAILPNGDEAIISLDSSNNLLLISGILSGRATTAELITTASVYDGVVISNDGLVLLGRGGSGLGIFSIASITPAPGALGGTVSHSFTPLVEFPDLSTYYTEDGRDGMAISPTDSSRAVVISPNSSTITLLTGLTSTPVEGTPVAMPSGVTPYSVSITPDGKLAIVGTSGGLLMYSGIDTGTVAQVGTTVYAPTYTLSSNPVTLGDIPTLGITLDGKYVVAGDQSNHAVVVFPYTASGFGAAASVLGSVAISDNDELLIH